VQRLLEITLMDSYTGSFLARIYSFISFSVLSGYFFSWRVNEVRLPVGKP
jgi:hypothetical protein